MRVLHVLHSMTFGGAEVLVHDFVQRTAHAATHAVVCLDGMGPLGESLRAGGVRVEVLGRREGFDPNMIVGLRRRIAEVAPDVVVAHQYTPYSYAAMALATLPRRPGLVFVEHGRHYPDQRRPKRVLANRAAFLPITQRVIAVCAYIKELLIENEGIGAHRIDVVYNGVDPARFDPASTALPDRRETRASWGLDETHRVITCVARFHPVKDHPTLVRGFADCAARDPRARLVLVGGGDDGALRALASERGVAERVVFTGVRRDIPAVYDASDVFAMSSLSEGTSVTLLESMLAERPSVVTGVGGNPEIVDPGRTGWLVGRGDAAALGDALTEALGDKDRARAMGKAGRQRVLGRFTQAQMHTRWLSLFEEASRCARRGR